MITRFKKKVSSERKQKGALTDKKWKNHCTTPRVIGKEGCVTEKESRDTMQSKAENVREDFKLETEDKLGVLSGALNKWNSSIESSEIKYIENSEIKYWSRG